MTNLKESTIPHNHSELMRTAYKLDLTLENSEEAFKILMHSMAVQLKKMVDKNRVALRINDDEGKLLFAGIVTYHDNEENKDMPGNFSYEFTTDEEDLKDCDNVITNTNVDYVNSAIVIGREHNINFINETGFTNVIVSAARTLISWLDTNASAKEEMGVEIDGYFAATVGVEDGEKIISIVPGSQMKRLIKGDAEIEK